MVQARPDGQTMPCNIWMDAAAMCVTRMPSADALQHCAELPLALGATVLLHEAPAGAAELDRLAVPRRPPEDPVLRGAA